MLGRVDSQPISSIQDIRMILLRQLFKKYKAGCLPIIAACIYNGRIYYSGNGCRRLVWFHAESNLLFGMIRIFGIFKIKQIIKDSLFLITKKPCSVCGALWDSYNINFINFDDNHTLLCRRATGGLIEMLFKTVRLNTFKHEINDNYLK
jgi:hypothetical protein